jgi:hypothetical protein
LRREDDVFQAHAHAEGHESLPLEERLNFLEAQLPREGERRRNRLARVLPLPEREPLRRARCGSGCAQHTRALGGLATGTRCGDESGANGSHQ